MTCPEYVVDLLPVIVASRSQEQTLPVGAIGPPTWGLSYDVLPCDGREYDPGRYPDLHALLQGMWRVRRWRWVPFVYRTVTGGAYGENRVPDLRGKVAT